MRNFLSFLAALPSLVGAAAGIADQQIPLSTSNVGDQEPLVPIAYWYEAITHDGTASFMQPPCKSNYSVFRNVVVDFNADNTGHTDASDAIQAAIDAAAKGCSSRAENAYGTTGQPAIVYLPQGTYLMAQSIQLRLGTVLMGDPIQPPTLKATGDFPPNSHIILAKDHVQPGTNNFFIAIRNLVIDSTNVDKDTSIGHIDWTVSQATQLTNIVFNMPNFSNGHMGITVALNYPPFPDPSGFNSNIILNDLTFNGGAVGMLLNGQQWLLKGMTFNRCTTGIVANGKNVVVHNSTFNDCTTGINAIGNSGSLTVLDTTTSNIGTLVNSSDSNSAFGSIILENIKNDGQTVVMINRLNVILTGSVPNTWVHGNFYPRGASQPQFQEGTGIITPRASVLTFNGNYFTMKPPTYQEYSVDEVVNIKNVPSLPVLGDGVSDDTVHINAILQQSINKVVYFPAGTYMVSDSIILPPGSRIIGDPYASAISAAASVNFFNPDAPTAMVKLGISGEVGVGQISDMMFTVSDVLQGCKLLEVNMAGKNPGDVGIWNSHFRVGGAAGSKVKTVCSLSPDQCKAAWGMLHLTNTSSAYIENMWGWTADHDLDGGPGSVGPPVIAVGRGALIEATQGTWLVGTAMEHNTLYQYNFNNAANVCSVFQQSETPYWQGPGWPGPGQEDLAPAPWTDNLAPSDPTFSNCLPGDAQCGMAWFEVIDNSSDIFLYGGCVWSFFNGGVNSKPPCQGSFCQKNAISVSQSTGTYLYGTNVKDIQNMIISDGQNVALQNDNKGGFGGVVAAYLFNSF